MTSETRAFFWYLDLREIKSSSLSDAVPVPPCSCSVEIKLLISNIRQNVCLSLWTLSTQISLYCSRQWPAQLNIRQDLKYWTGGNQQVNIGTLNQRVKQLFLIPPAWLTYITLWIFCGLIPSLAELSLQYFIWVEHKMSIICPWLWHIMTHTFQSYSENTTLSR